MTPKEEMAAQMAERTKTVCANATARAVIEIATHCHLNHRQSLDVLEILTTLVADVATESLELSRDLVNLEGDHYGR